MAPRPSDSNRRRGATPSVAPSRKRRAKESTPKPSPVEEDAPSSRPNRRVKRERPSLAPPVSTEKPRPSRLRSPRMARVLAGLTVLAKLVVAGALVVGGVAVYRLVHSYVMRAPSFAIATIAVGETERIDEPSLLAAADVAIGDNIFRRSTEQLQSALVDHPWVASAEVKRRLPNHLSITVVEHRPVALLVMDGTYLVGADGTVFKEVELGDPVDLPVITGLDEAHFVANRAFRTAVLLDAVALLHDYRSAGLWRREPIGEIAVEPLGGLTLRVGDDAMLVRLGHGPHREKLKRLRRVLDRLAETQSRPAYVYLDNDRRPDRVTLRLREPYPDPAHTFGPSSDESG